MIITLATIIRLPSPTEDDVLHATDIPTFNDTLSISEATTLFQKVQKLCLTNCARGIITHTSLYIYVYVYIYWHCQKPSIIMSRSNLIQRINLYQNEARQHTVSLFSVRAKFTFQIIEV